MVKNLQSPKLPRVDPNKKLPEGHLWECGKMFFLNKREVIAVRKGFTLIEMLVTIAVISIVAGAVIVGINPAKRLADAQNSGAKQNTRQVAAVIESCLAYVDPAGTTYTQKLPGDCDEVSELTGGGFARSVPQPTGFAINSNSTAVCVSYQGASASVHWKYYTATQTQSGGVVFQSTGACSDGV